MEVPLDNVQEDMEVYGSDGEKIGNVGGVDWERNFYTASSQPDVAVQSETRYLKVNRPGFLDIVGDDLYVPETAIRSTSFDRGVVLDCTKDECIERYKKKPNVL